MIGELFHVGKTVECGNGGAALKDGRGLVSESEGSGTGGGICEWGREMAEHGPRE